MSRDIWTARRPRTPLRACKSVPIGARFPLALARGACAPVRGSTVHGKGACAPLIWPRSLGVVCYFRDFSEPAGQCGPGGEPSLSPTTPSPPPRAQGQWRAGHLPLRCGRPERKPPGHPATPQGHVSPGAHLQCGMKTPNFSFLS